MHLAQRAGAALPPRGGGEDPPFEGEGPLGDARRHALEVVEQAGQLARLTGHDLPPPPAGKEAVEVDEGVGRVLGPPLGGVARGEGAEEGVGQEAGRLELGHGHLVRVLLPQEGEGMGHQVRETEGEVDDPGEEGGEELVGFLLPAVVGEVVVEVVEPPAGGVARVVHQYGVRKLVGIGDGPGRQGAVYQLPSWHNLLPCPLAVDGVLAHLGAGHLHVMLVPDVLEVVWERGARGVARFEQDGVRGRRLEWEGQERVSRRAEVNARKRHAPPRGLGRRWRNIGVATHVFSRRRGF